MKYVKGDTHFWKLHILDEVYQKDLQATDEASYNLLINRFEIISLKLFIVSTLPDFYSG